jgi:transposase
MPSRHPLHRIKRVVDAARHSLDTAFAGLYTGEGRPPIASGRLLLARLVQILFSIRSARRLVDHLECNLLFQRFVGPSIGEPLGVPTVFTNNRDRLLNTAMARKLLAAVLTHERCRATWITAPSATRGTAPSLASRGEQG